MLGDRLGNRNALWIAVAGFLLPPPHLPRADLDVLI
jgi:hypothetical protein